MSTASFPPSLAAWFAGRGWRVRRHQLDMLAAAEAGHHTLQVLHQPGFGDFKLQRTRRNGFSLEDAFNLGHQVVLLEQSAGQVDGNRGIESELGLPLLGLTGGFADGPQAHFVDQTRGFGQGDELGR